MPRLSFSPSIPFETMHLSTHHTFHTEVPNLCHSYFDVVKEPMDLSTIGAKLEEGMYKDRFAFRADFQLMVANAKLYNMPGSFVHNGAIALEVFFDKRKN